MYDYPGLLLIGTVLAILAGAVVFGWRNGLVRQIPSLAGLLLTVGAWRLLPGGWLDRIAVLRPGGVIKTDARALCLLLFALSYLIVWLLARAVLGALPGINMTNAVNMALGSSSALILCMAKMAVICAFIACFDRGPAGALVSSLMGNSRVLLVLAEIGKQLARC